MSRTHSVSYYDVLGVERDASAEDIKRAWREATDKFEPGTGSGQFRLFSDAADTLLDPAKRSAYDAELDGEGPDPTAHDDTAPVAAAAVSTPAEVPSRGSTVARGAEDTEDSEKAAKAERARAKAERKQQRAEQRAAVPRRPLTRRATALLVLFTVLTVAVVVAAVLLFSKQRAAAEADQAGDQASAAAERSLPAVLSYDYQQLKADRARAVPFLSDKYRKEYTATFDKLIESSGGTPSPAAQAKAVVKATVENVGVADAEPDRVRLVVFLNQATTKDGGTPTFSLNRLVVTMTKSGNSWLVDNIVSY